MYGKCKGVFGLQCTIDLTLKDRKRREDADDDSVLPTDWLEHTAELHPSLDPTFGPRTWRCLAMGDLMTQYGSFYTNPDRQFGNWCAHTSIAYNQETDKKVQALQVGGGK